MTIDESRQDRARGAILGSAAGDALGAAYEFGCAAVGAQGPQMLGGGLGGFAPGEWTDDTTMAWPILDALARGLDLRSPEGLTWVARAFRTWFETRPPDIGKQIRQVLAAVGPEPTPERMTEAASALHHLTGKSAGNGSLMRTGPVALGYLQDPQACAQAAAQVSGLTHFDPLAEQACILWSLAIRHAVLHADLDIRVGLDLLEPGAQVYWMARIAEAEQQQPEVFSLNGFVVPAFQAAWSSISHTSVTPTQAGQAHLVAVLDRAIRIGNDTDTVAAIAGALLGARWGASAVPQQWRSMLHGYPGLTGEDLVALADRVLA